MFAERADFAVRGSVTGAVAGVALVLLDEEIHREVDSGELAARDLKIARLLGPPGENKYMVVVEKSFDRDGDPHLEVCAEDDSLDLHLLDAAIDDRLVELEVGNAIAE